MILHQYKIVFGGSMGAGKSSAIQALSEISVFSTEVMNTDTSSHDKLKTTVGIDYGEITLEDGIKIGLYGTPGQDRFDFIWPIICQNALGTIVLVDHSNVDAIQELSFYLEKFKIYSLDNIVIGITHIDANKNVPSTLYHDWLQSNNLNYPLFFIDAREKNDILLLLEALMTSVEFKFDGF